MKRAWLSLAIVPLLAGCGTMTNGPLQKIGVESDPYGAVVTTKGCSPSDPTFKTPGTFWADRAATKCTVTIDAEGYVPLVVTLERHESAASDANFEGVISDEGDSFSDSVGEFVVSTIFGFILTGVDAATGGLYELDPSYIAVQLSPEQESPDTGDLPQECDERSGP